MAKNFPFFLKKVIHSFSQSHKKKSSNKILDFSNYESRKNYIVKVDLEILESQMKQAFQELGKLTYKQIDKRAIKKNSKKNKLIAKIIQLQKEINNKKKTLKP